MDQQPGRGEAAGGVAQGVLERATRMWRLTVDTIDEPIILINPHFELQRTNLAAARLAGAGVKALLGRRCHEALFARATPCEGCPLSAEGGDDGVQRVEIERGERAWAVSAWRFEEEGEAATAVCHYHEITEARALQRRLLLYTKLAAVGELAGVVAHELNNPLTGILTFSQILRRGGLPSGAVEGLATDIEEAAQRCSRIVQSLLDYARPTGDAAPYAMVELDPLIETCVRLNELQISAHQGLKFEASWAGLGSIWGNADALKSLVLNLLNNAAQALNKQGHISLSATRSGDDIEIRVSDDGPGIPAALRERIFEPFFTTKAKNKGGTGLGLSIVRNVVDAHGGRVHVEASPQGGACFIVALPARAGAKG
ncbi:PAS domain-containing protein [Myxococcota bacterium]|nr:PAS domain-containing protein [Myxococcota bacterium]MBU1431533.1 PAS domain-containing protein [Myxococcota bacterium]MBU1899630.1 PAS domain-containing protein [Myxococcota bacterium]